MALKGILRFCTSVRLSKELTRSWPQNSGRGSVRPLKKHVYITRVGAILEKEHRGLWFMIYGLWIRPSWRKHLADIIWSESYNVLLTCC